MHIFSVKPDPGTVFSQGRRAACVDEWQYGIRRSHGGLHVKQQYRQHRLATSVSGCAAEAAGEMASERVRCHARYR